MIRAYTDAGVLFTAWRGEEPSKTIARAFINESDSRFVSSSFLELETLPKAAFRRNAAEVLYYESFFSLVIEWATVDDGLVEEAIELGRRYDITNLDALHAASAIRLRADQFVTTEKPGRPLYRLTQVEVVYLPTLGGA